MESIHWSQNPHFDIVVADREVANKIVECRAHADLPPISAEAWLGAFSSLGSAASLEGLGLTQISGTLGHRAGRKAGFKVERSKSENIPLPIGRAIAASACSLFYRGQEIVGVVQRVDGCTIHSNLPSDFSAFEGRFAVTVCRITNESTQVDADVKILGQLIDWGKSRRILSKFYEDLEGFTAIGA